MQTEPNKAQKQIIEAVEQELIYFNHEWETTIKESEVHIRLLKTCTSVTLKHIITACTKIGRGFYIQPSEDKIELVFDYLKF